MGKGLNRNASALVICIIYIILLHFQGALRPSSISIVVIFSNFTHRKTKTKIVRGFYKKKFRVISKFNENEILLEAIL